MQITNDLARKSQATSTVVSYIPCALSKLIIYGMDTDNNSISN
jgi:hypothetical protein